MREHADKGLLERLFADHGRALLRYFKGRLRIKADASDLMQEVYLRFMRVRNADEIRDPQRYLFTIAHNLLKEHAIDEQRSLASLDIDDVAVSEQLGHAPTFDLDLDECRNVARLRPTLERLRPKCQAVFALRYGRGLSYKEIGEQLGVSSNMVKKYLSQGLAQLREQMAGRG